MQIQAGNNTRVDEVSIIFQTIQVASQDGLY